MPGHDFALPGRIIDGKYRVERVLGEGGMGVVVEATNLALGRRVAIKMLHGQGDRSQEMLDRFLREARAAGQLTSEHVARVIDVGATAQSEPYIVMELLSGNDLEKELASRGPLPVADAIDYVLQACVGLAEAHARGLVHRDIKPANLFLSRRSPASKAVLKILDFGLSKVANDNSSITQSGAAFGTPLYMSPEQTRSAKHVDARTDQHALGLVLYELLVGQPAFLDESTTAVLIAIAVKRAPRVRVKRPDVPMEVDDAVARALEKSPDDRFDDLAAFAAALAPFAGQRGAELAAAVAAELAGPASFGDRHPTKKHRIAIDNDSEPTRVIQDPSPAVSAGDQVPTRDLARREAAQTQGALTADSDPTRRHRSNRMTALLVGGGVLALGAATLAWAVATRWSGQPRPVAPAQSAISASSQSIAVTAPSTSEPAPRATAIVAPPAIEVHPSPSVVATPPTSAPSATPPPAQTSKATAPRASTGPHAPKPPTPAPESSTPRDVFSQ